MLVDLGQQLCAGLGQAAFGIPHRGGIVAVERTEVARAIHERIAEREGLGHADERFIERRVAVRVVAPHHVADDFCAFAEPGVGRQVLLPHRVQNAALNGLEAVPHIRQRTGGNDRERVVEGIESVPLRGGRPSHRCSWPGMSRACQPRRHLSRRTGARRGPYRDAWSISAPPALPKHVPCRRVRSEFVHLGGYHALSPPTGPEAVVRSCRAAPPAP